MARRDLDDMDTFKDRIEPKAKYSHGFANTDKGPFNLMEDRRSLHDDHILHHNLNNQYKNKMSFQGNR